MEASIGLSPSTTANPMDLDSDLQSFQLQVAKEGSRFDHDFHSMSPLEILRETVWILRYNSTGLLSIMALLIFPVSALLLSNVLVNQSLVKKLTVRILLGLRSSGISLRPFIEQLVHKFSEMVVATAVSFPLCATSLLLSKAAIIYSVNCTYSREHFDALKFYVIITKIWKRIIFTYLWVCTAISGCFTLFIVILVAITALFSISGFPSISILYPSIVLVAIFSIIIANCIVICNIAIVISVLEDVAGLQALLKSNSLIKGKTRVGVLMFFGMIIGMAFVKGLFEHRVKTLSYGDGSSRLWEGPLLVIMHSFLLLLDSMMFTVLYFTCKSGRIVEARNEESQPILEATKYPSTSSEAQ
ncbi:unnamed protein product [Cuscuta epithymum]|uniref:Uncharacterized protein n=1 Tax=Cuscuta epithymum TaxID=186058 RepID=A0AAV0F0F2_9ASTE|nr:unnamed protein product [Cuscuta epithymum]